MDERLQELMEQALQAFDMSGTAQIMALTLVKSKARELNLYDDIVEFIEECRKEDKAIVKEEKAIQRRDKLNIELATDGNGLPKNTTDNYYQIMISSPYYANVRYNVLLDAPEIHEGNSKRRWSDTDKAWSKSRIEKAYKIHSSERHADALLMLFREREYNPILELINDSGKTWDGVNRIEDCLHKWMLCDDTPYAREVSRLIFAGGINRLMQPGCKFDEVPVLIGSKQGEGKSTFVSWLALNDEFFGEVKVVEGSGAIEQLKGKWICEIQELSAFTKAKDIEAVKAFITRRYDDYRKPYAENPVSLPRRCVFIGTTNTREFLVDKTGNRRFYPIECHNTGYNLFDYEDECKEYIMQCWLEAIDRYNRHDNIAPFAKRELKVEYEKAQEASMQDDWRVGMIGEFLSHKAIGEYVCAKEIMNKALSPEPDHPKDPSPKDSKDIGQIIQKSFPEWAQSGSHRFIDYGIQRSWKKKSASPTESNTIAEANNTDELPF